MSLVIANWKMQLSLAEAETLAKHIRPVRKAGHEVVVCPSFPHLATVGKILRRTKIRLGAQDVFWKDVGAYTGEVSTTQLVELGCRYVIIGHSERRVTLHETDEMIRRKCAAALAAGLIPVLCIGETDEQRRTGQQDYALIAQLQSALAHIKLQSGQELVIAYEPASAIGTGQPVLPRQIAHAQQVIAHALRDLIPAGQLKDSVRIIYGGSVDAQRIAGCMVPGIDGVLIGTASRPAKTFIQLVRMIS
jgi:triosephosphate isomerase